VVRRGRLCADWGGKCCREKEKEDDGDGGGKEGGNTRLNNNVRIIQSSVPVKPSYRRSF